MISFLKAAAVYCREVVNQIAEKLFSHRRSATNSEEAVGWDYASLASDIAYPQPVHGSTRYSPPLSHNYPCNYPPT